MELFVHQLSDGVAAGAIYASLALSIVFIHRSTKFVNFGQGAMATFTMYVAWQSLQWGLPLPLTVLLALVLGAGLGVAVYSLLIRHFEGQSELGLVIGAVAVFLLLTEASSFIWGGTVRTFPQVFPSRPIDIGGVGVGIPTLGTVAVLLLELAVIGAVFRWTRTGLAMRAVATNRESAELSGVRTQRVVALSWALAGALGAVSGVLVVPDVFLFPGTMFPVLIYAITSATLGGLDSPIGAVVGAMVVGVSENLVGTYVPGVGSDLKIGVAFLIVAGGLLLRPQGLFGRHSAVRV